MKTSKQYWINLNDNSVIGEDTGAQFRLANRDLKKPNGFSAIKIIKIGFGVFTSPLNEIKQFGLLEEHLTLIAEYKKQRNIELRQEIEWLEKDLKICSNYSSYAIEQAIEECKNQLYEGF